MRLADTLFRVPRTTGIVPLQLRGQGGAKDLSSWRLRLEPGQMERFRRPGEESYFILQEGQASLRCAGEEHAVSRSAVFEERASAFYLPPGAELEVEATAPTEGIFVSSPSGDDDRRPAFLPPDGVRVADRGRGAYGRRVHDISVGDEVSVRMLVGETFNPAGGWSSFPPHKHDGRNGEPALEEVYHYRIRPAGGFALQVLYSPGEDGETESVTHQIADGDAVLLPYGYHPVAAAPGYELYYLWVLVGGRERRLALYEDPEHRWIHEQD